MRKRLALSLLVLWLWVSPASAQLLVYDPANFAENAITAVESALTTIQTILIEFNQILELTPLEGLAVYGGIAEDMALLADLVVQAEGLSYDISSIQAQIDALFHLDTAPDTRDGLTERLAEIKHLKYQCYSYAARVQTLLTTVIRTTEHLLGLLDTVSAIVGNMGGNQTMVQGQAVLGKHVANLDIQMASFHRAQTVDKLSEALIIESVNRIQAVRIEDWPTW